MDVFGGHKTLLPAPPDTLTVTDPHQPGRTKLDLCHQGVQQNTRGYRGQARRSALPLAGPCATRTAFSDHPPKDTENSHSESGRAGDLEHLPPMVHIPVSTI
jgi:hypothetical protein